MRTRLALLSFPVGLAGCLEYSIGTKPDDPVPEIDTDEAVPPILVDTAPPARPSCVGVTVTSTGWRATAPFATQADPTDGSGRPFWSPDYDSSAMAPITLPDVAGIPAGQDRAYRGSVTVQGVAPSVVLDLRTDDGVIVWIDGVRLGSWGGAWQQEGCVNIGPDCGTDAELGPVDASAQLTPGTHVLAFRVSNPLLDAFADIVPRCQELSE